VEFLDWAVNVDTKSERERKPRHRNVLRYGLWVVLGGSLLANLGMLVVLDRALHYREYLKFYEAQHLNTGFHASPKSPGFLPDETTPELLLVAGDSLTENWSLAAFFQQPTLNLGVGGQVTGEILERLESLRPSLRAGTAVISGGTNDVLYSVQRGQDTSNLSVEIQRNCAKMAVEAKIHAAHVIVASIPPVRSRFLFAWAKFGSWGDETRDRTNQLIVQANRGLEECAQEHGVYYWDTFSSLVDASGDLAIRFSLPDGIHLNLAAYKTMSTKLKVLLREGRGAWKSQQE
jgi:lysophospholipase L1-like esterase